LTLNKGAGNTYTGGTTINGGKLIAANDVTASLSATGNGPVAVNSGGTLGGNGGVGGTAGTGLVTVASGGHIAPGLTTGTTIGTLSAFSGLSLGSGSRLDMDLGAPVFGTSGSSDRIDMPGTYGSFAFTVPAAANSIGVNLSDPGGAAGNGTYTLMSFQAGQYTGSSNANQFFTSSQPSANSLNGATIAYHLADNSNVIQDGSPTSATRVIMTVTGGPNALTWTGANSGTWDVGTTANFNSATTGASSTFAGNDNVTFDDTGTNTNPITIDAGGVQPNIVAINNSTTTYTFSGGDIKGSSLGGGGGLFLSGTGAATINNNYTAAGPITSNKSGTTGVATFSGNITAATAVTVNGGTLTLAGTNTYTGSNTINGGTLSVGADNNLGAVPGSPAANFITISGGTLQTTGTFTLNPNRGITASASSSAINNAPGTTLTYGGVVSGTGGLTQTGGGTLLLTGNANTYTGNTSVVGGAAGSTLKNGIDNALPTGTQLNLNGVASGGNATFDLNGFDQTVGGIALTGPAGAGGTITNSSGGAAKNFTVNNSTAKTFGGVISGNLNLVKNGSGTLTLTGADTYTGDTKDLGVGGKLSISTPYLADAADVYLVTGSTFGLDFAAAPTTDTIRSLFINNVSQATGTWGAPGSGAAHTSSLFSGIGWLNVTVGGLTGDYNNDGKVDAGDYVVWRKNPGAFGGPAGYDTWRANFGNPPGAGSGLSDAGSAVPEPATLSLVVMLFSWVCIFGRARNNS
jgi:autotransporter-associated beta strand protein